MGLQEIVGKHVLKVEPLNAVLDPQYFVRAVHGCVLSALRARSEQNQRRAAENAGYGCCSPVLQKSACLCP
jgi:hypothetical protein